MAKRQSGKPKQRQRPRSGAAGADRPLSKSKAAGALADREPGRFDRHTLYELCVQSPRHLAPLLVAIHGGHPRTLGEDFSGTAALSREWVRTVPEGRAIAVDLDAEVLERARTHAHVRTVRGNAMTAPRPKRDAADVIFVGNFSIGEIHNRKQLVKYLARSRSRLTRRGVFVCDTYGGESAFRLGAVHRIHPGPDNLKIRYTWEQRKADPLTGEVQNAMHFRVDRSGWIIQEETDAFVYNWRLWSIPELRDAMLEAGFSRVEVYDKVPDAIDHEGKVYVRPVERVEDSFIVCVAARK